MAVHSRIDFSTKGPCAAAAIGLKRRNGCSRRSRLATVRPKGLREWLRTRGAKGISHWLGVLREDNRAVIRADGEAIADIITLMN